MVKHTPQEKAAAHTAKLHYNELCRKHPKRVQEEQDAALKQILDSPTPEWGSLTVKINSFVN
jgi:hypothetical protein